MKDIQTIEGLKKLVIFDIENLCRYYKFFYAPTLQLLDVIDVDNYNIVQYDISNLVLRLKWNMWKGMLSVSILQKDELIRTIKFGISDDIVLCYSPDFNGSYFKFIISFDMKDSKRGMYVYKTYDAMEIY